VPLLATTARGHRLVEDLLVDAARTADGIEVDAEVDVWRTVADMAPHSKSSFDLRFA
jgi:hypothetical protein